jgi:hypothetical protein
VIAAKKRKHATRTHSRGGVLFRLGRHGPHPHGQQDVDRTEIRRRAVGQTSCVRYSNGTEAEVLWLVVGAPEELEFLPDTKTKPDMSLIYPVDPTQLPKELAGVEWPRGEDRK